MPNCAVAFFAKEIPGESREESIRPRMEVVLSKVQGKPVSGDEVRVSSGIQPGIVFHSRSEGRGGPDDSGLLNFCFKTLPALFLGRECITTISFGTS